MKMCIHGNTQRVKVKVQKEESHKGKAYWKNAEIDSCIAPIVQALNRDGVWTRGSCCGHGKTLGEIMLGDGRTLLVLPVVDPPKKEVTKVNGARFGPKEKANPYADPEMGIQIKSH